MGVKEVLIVVTVIAVYGFGYYNCNQSWELRYSEFRTESEKQYNDLLKEKIAIDNANREKVNAIERDFLEQIQKQKVKYEKDIADLRTNFKPSGVYTNAASGVGMSRTDNDPAELICYTRGELQRKIESTLDIARECDELALKYNALLEIAGGNKRCIEEQRPN